MRKYVIYSDEGDPGEFLIVNARNPEEAKELYCRLFEIKRPDYLEYVYSEQTADLFEKDEKGKLFSYSPQAGYRQEAEGLIIREDLTVEDAMIIIASNIRELFKTRPEFYDLYLEYYHNCGEIQMEEPAQYVVCENWGLRPDSTDFHRRWRDMIARTHERFNFPEDMLVMLAIASWTGDKKIESLSQFEIN